MLVDRGVLLQDRTEEAAVAATHIDNQAGGAEVVIGQDTMHRHRGDVPHGAAELLSFVYVRAVVVEHRVPTRPPAVVVRSELHPPGHPTTGGARRPFRRGRTPHRLGMVRTEPISYWRERILAGPDSGEHTKRRQRAHHPVERAGVAPTAPANCSLDCG